MFIYGLSRGITYEWLKDELVNRAQNAVIKGFKGLTQVAIDYKGNVYGICGGSAYSFTPQYYKDELLWITNDPHGIGIVLLALIELDEMLKKESHSNWF